MLWQCYRIMPGTEVPELLLCNFWGNLFPALTPGLCELMGEPILKPSVNAGAPSGDGRVRETCWKAQTEPCTASSAL